MELDALLFHQRGNRFLVLAASGDQCDSGTVANDFDHDIGLQHLPRLVGVVYLKALGQCIIPVDVNGQLIRLGGATLLGCQQYNGEAGRQS